MTRRICSLLCIVVGLVSCRPSSEAPRPPDIAPAAAAPSDPVDPTVVFIQGSPKVHRGEEVLAAVEGMLLRKGDRVVTDDVSSLELAFGTFATLRVLPSSDVAVRSFRSGTAHSSGGRGAELGIGAGAILAKVRKLMGDEEFIIATQNSAAGVRGTEFLVRYEAALPAGTLGAARTARTLVAVREGRVALLPAGNLMEGLLDGRDANPIAGAVVKTAFAFAPAAGPGEELAVGGSAGPEGAAKEAAAQEAAEAAYGALLNAAENAAAAGFDLEASADPASLIAAPSTDSGSRIRKAFDALSPSVLKGSDAALLELLDRVRDPGSETSRLPAALPLEGFRSVPKSPGQGTSSAPAPRNPAVLWSSRLSGKDRVASLTRIGDFLIVTGADGIVRALTREGKTAWSSGSGVVAATALDATLVLTGAESISVVEGRDGAELGRWAFEGWAGTPRSKAVPVPEGVTIATPRGVAVLRSENASLVREIVIEGGVSAPPILAGRELVAITGRGNLAIIDLGTNSVASEVLAGLTENAFALRYRDGLVCAADRSGKVVVLEVASRSLRWERSLGAGIASEAEMDGDRVYLWTAAKTLVTLSLADGAEARETVSGVESEPLLSSGRLYWGAAGGKLVVAEAASGRVLKRIDVGFAQSVRPLMIGGALYAGTADGRIVKIDPAK